MLVHVIFQVRYVVGSSATCIGVVVPVQDVRDALPPSKVYLPAFVQCENLCIIIMFQI